MAARFRLTSGMLLLATLAACAGPTTPPTPGGTPKPRPRATGAPGIVAGEQPSSLLPASTPPLAGGPSVPALDPGGGLISDRGGALTGKVKGPAGVIANNGAGLISDGGGGLISDGGGSLVANNSGNLVGNNAAGYRLQAIAEVPYANMPIALRYADGAPVKDAAGADIKGTTDAEGNYRLPYPGGDRHVIVVADLPGRRGSIVAFVPRGPLTAPKPVDADLASTLSMGYILTKYVRTQADPRAVLERLPAELEAETRQIVAAAVDKAGAAPGALTPAAVLDAVERLRGAEGGVDAQLEAVRQVLLAGLSDQGAGQPATNVETDAFDVAVSPAGEIHYASPIALRVWKKDAQGRIQAVAGTGVPPADAARGVNASPPGDGGPAAAAFLEPTALAYAPDGTLLVADSYHRSVRAIGPDGVIRTRVAHASFDAIVDLVAEPDGGIVVACATALWRVPPGGGAPGLLAGDVREPVPTDIITKSPVGDDVKPLDARFTLISSVARDPLDGSIVVADAKGQVFRVGMDLVTRVAGTDAFGYGGDDGPAKAAQLGLTPSVFVRADGGVLIGDPANHRLREVVDGTIRTIGGTGQARMSGDGGPILQAGLLEPRRPTRGPDGSLYFVDQGYVRRLAGGVVSTVIGGTSGFDVPRPANEVQLLGPSSLKYEATTNTMWVSDQRHLWRWTLADNRLVSVLGGGPAGQAFAEAGQATASAVYGPRGLILEGPDTWLLLATDPAINAGRLLRVAGGAMTMVAGGGAYQPVVVTKGPALGATVSAMDNSLVAHDGYVYYLINALGYVLRFKEGGDLEKWGGFGSGTEDGTTAGQFKFGKLLGFAQGPDGQFYLGSEGAIYRVDPATKVVTRVAGQPGAPGGTGDGGPARDAKVGNPTAFAWDAAGDLYFTEADRASVRRIRKADGTIAKVAGHGTPNLAGATVDTGVGSPYGLAFDGAGNLYVADARHGQVKIVPKAQLAP